MAQKMGLSVADLNEFTIAMLNDLADEILEAEAAEEADDDAREATQADYDAF